MASRHRTTLAVQKPVLSGIRREGGFLLRTLPALVVVTATLLGRADAAPADSGLSAGPGGRGGAFSPDLRPPAPAELDRSPASVAPGAVRLHGRGTERRMARDWIEVEGRTFGVQHEGGLRELRSWLEARLESVAAERRIWNQQQAARAARVDRLKAPPEELRALLSEPPATLAGRHRRGLRELMRLVDVAIEEPARREESVRWMREVAVALRNNVRPPAPSRLEIGQPPLTFLDYSHNPVARGETLAANIVPGPGEDPGSIDPAGSSFWRRPSAVSGLDLHLGFGRAQDPELGEPIWDYAAPKTSYGGCPGFDLTDGRRVVKVKLAETHSEPFAARLFWALGYRVDPTDHAPALKVRYDRRLFREFHLRKPVQTRICALWLLPVHTIDLQRRYDPFAFVERAVLNDGTVWSGAELKQRLLLNARREHPEDDPANFRPEVEARIRHLVLTAANVQYREEEGRSLGPWEFGGLGHEDLRELRGVGLLAAWMGWFDSRFENTRLRVEDDPEPGSLAGGSRRLVHVFTDLGGGLGRALGPLSRRAEAPDVFEWTFTRPRVVQGPGRMTIPFRITGWEPIEDTLAFEQMTWDDARWMARWLGRLSEDQVAAALIASGLDSAHVRLYLAKLGSRRDRMLQDLDLAGEIPLWRPLGWDRKFSYDPRREPAVSARLPNGRIVVAPIGGSAVREGRLIGATGSGPSERGPRAAAPSAAMVREDGGPRD